MKIGKSFLEIEDKSCSFAGLSLVRLNTYCIITLIKEPVHEISNNVVCATSKASDQPLQTHSQIRAFASRLNIT